MIVYRKGTPLRVRRSPAPEPPFWAATTVAPYSPRRATPIAIDYLDLRATGSEKLEVGVADNVRGELERRNPQEPVFIEATEMAEEIFRRGESALELCEEWKRGAIHLVSTRGALPERAASTATIVIAAWPLELTRLGELFDEARRRELRWGVAVPVIYPVTTDLEVLAKLAELAVGAAFLAPLPIELDPTAKQALAAERDDDTYAMLFHSDVEPLHTATERHLAALAEEHGMADFILPPRWEEKSNWNGAVLLTLTASRMIAMEQDLDLAGTLARSARLVAELDKPIARIAEAASLAIVEALDETSVEILTEWIETGSAGFVDFVNRRWRLRRDHGVG
ncbi:MAG TPA: hypothetical protein VGF69_25455 [Thermoanaerobaculia bacterium]|jgi:hypothetical protein